MFHRSKVAQVLTGLVTAPMLAALLAGCSQTAAPEPNIIQRAEGEKPAPPAPSGFLGSDYALLKPGAQGSGQQALLAYTNMTANFTSYNKVVIAPVTFWGDNDTNLSAADQQTLCDYF